MFKGKERLDERDLFLHSHIGKWVILTWRGDLFPPPMGKAYGTHLASFIFCPYGEEIRGLNYSWLYLDQERRVFHVGSPQQGINATWFFKHSTLHQFTTSPLSSQEVNFLELPDLNPAFHEELSEEVKQIRADSCLRDFRHPSYPDDVAVACGSSITIPDTSCKIQSEQVWVRIAKRKNGHYSGELLVQPNFHAFEKGQTVNVHILESKQGSILVCGQPDADKSDSTVQTFEKRLEAQREQLFGIALFLQGIEIVYSDQPEILEVNRQSFKNIKNRSETTLLQADALLKKVKANKAQTEELIRFEFPPHDGDPMLDQMTQRALTLATVYNQMFPGRPRTKKLSDAELEILMEMAADQPEPSS